MTTTELSVEVVRVFTRGGQGGNPLGIVTGTLSQTSMQRIAAAVGFSETVFVDSHERTSVRIFTPALEIPFAGHPLVGAAWWLNRRDGSERGRIHTSVGAVTYLRDSQATYVTCPGTQPVHRLNAPDQEWIATRGAWLVEVPTPFHLLEVDSPEAVVSIESTPPDELSHVFVFSWSSETEVKARFFAPGVGVPEDPATGSAAVALASVLRSEGSTSGHITIKQGDEIGYPSTIELLWDEASTTIGGEVVADSPILLRFPDSNTS